METGGRLFSVRTSGDVAAATAALRSVLRDLDPLLPIDRVGPIEGLVTASVSRQRLYATLLSAFSAVALLIAALGLYGVTAYTVRSRTREIGVRMAVGASARQVGAVTVGRTICLALVGMTLGLVGAAMTTRLLSALLFGLTPTEPAVFVGVALLLAGVAALAATGPARHAAGVDPTVVLRTE
jgi:ABC-type antimicrobial peptide transport system permease subunit